MSSSGMSNIPSIVPYPAIMPLDDVPEIKGRMVYVIKWYENTGVSLLIYFNNGKAGVRIGDFDGNIIEQPSAASSMQYCQKLMEIMAVSRIKQAQFYFSNDTTLVDIRTSIDKMASPGMLKDLCSKIMPTQQIIKLAKADDELFKSIESEHVILKPSSFKIIIRSDAIVPLYAEYGRKHEADIITKKVAI